MRGQAHAGGLEKVRNALFDISVKDLSKQRSQDKFNDWLDARTENLRRRASRYGVKWGTARKALNLWLRDIVYNHHFRTTYRLEKLEPWLEVPLDSYTARFIRVEAKHLGVDLREPLQRWTTVKAVTPLFSAAYQQAACQIAKTPAFAYLQHAVHIDLAAWRNDDTMNKP